MAFTEATLQAQLNAKGLCCKITGFAKTASASYTCVTVQNLNTSAHKSGTVNLAQSLTAAQAAAALVAAL
jgi:hypothetical protein